MKHLPYIPSRPDAVNVAYWVERCRVLGPGTRAVVWVQGCPLQCPGCHTPWFRPPLDVEWVPADDLADRICRVEGIEGVTFVGGEPMCQPRALAKVSGSLRAAGLTTMVYTGLTLEQLRAGALPEAEVLLAAGDLLMDGPYDRDRPTSKPWRGSDNQRLIALSDAYRDCVAAWNRPVGQSFEVRLQSDGRLEVLGIPPDGLEEGQVKEQSHHG